MIDATPEPVVESEIEEKLQQLYLSCPDGTLLRFGINDGKIFVRFLRDHDKVGTSITQWKNNCNPRNSSGWCSLKVSTES